MKKRWEEPKIFVEQFTPNEYVAACGDENRVYKFVCDAGKGVWGSVYADSNHNGSLDPFDRNLAWGNYHACGKTHDAPTTDEFIDGFYYPNFGSGKAKVIIWTDNNTNVHCTTNLNMDSWTTAKS